MIARVHSVVAAGNLHTAEAAAEILRDGGNAADAAVAGALAAFVAEPLLSSAGGAGMLTFAPIGGKPAALDFFPCAPGLGGGRPSDLDFFEVVVNFGSAAQAFHVGRAAAAVPLAIAGLFETARLFGSRPLDVLSAPAIRLAREGVPVGAQTAHVYALLWKIQNISERTAALAGGAPPAVGTSLRNPAFADLLEESVSLGKPPERFVRALIEDFGVAVGGQITEADIAAAQPAHVAPREIDLGDGWRAFTSPRLGGARMSAIAKELLARERSSHAHEEPLRVALACQGGHALLGLGSTTHLSVLDRAGSVASVTLTNGEGCGHTAGESGIQLNNFLGEEDLNPGGFHRHTPGAPLPTMIAPTVVLHHGRPTLALGSGGSNRIRSVVAQVLERVVRGEHLEQAVLAPRVHAEQQDVWIEMPGRHDPKQIVQVLATRFARVHRFEDLDFFFGGVHSVMLGADGRAIGVGDPRRGGAVIYA